MVNLELARVMDSERRRQLAERLRIKALTAIVDEPPTSSNDPGTLKRHPLGEPRHLAGHCR